MERNEYIRKSDAIQAIKEGMKYDQVSGRTDWRFENGRMRSIADVNRVPAADVKPVVRGRWGSGRFHYDISYQEQCSICGAWSYDIGKFCQNCGAEMVDVVQEGDGNA